MCIRDSINKATKIFTNKSPIDKVIQFIPAVSYTHLRAHETPEHLVFRLLLEKKLLHGIEVVNELYYSEEALRLALENDLTIMGTSDIHGLVDWLFKVPDDNESSNSTLPCLLYTSPSPRDS